MLMIPMTAPFASSGSAKAVLVFVDLTSIKPFVSNDSDRPNTVPSSQPGGPGRRAAHNRSLPHYGSFRIVDDLCRSVKPEDVAR